MTAGHATQAIAVVDYAGGNLASAARALEAAARRASLAAAVAVTDDPGAIRRADRIVLPGQGAFADCRRGLAARPGLLDAVEARTEPGGAPFLGICVGMQLMAERGLEHEVTEGFGWIPGVIARMTPPPGAPAIRLPQVGWNALVIRDPAHRLLDGVRPGDHAYFVHSYALEDGDDADCLATVEYGGPRVAMVARGARAGTQFHVEKSQEVGLRILANFLRWEPEH